MCVALAGITAWALAAASGAANRAALAGELALGCAALGLLGLAVLYWADSRDRAAEAHAERADTLGAQLDYLVSASPAVLYSARAEPPYPIGFVTRNSVTVFGHVADVVASRGWVEPDHAADAVGVRRRAAESGHAVGEYAVRGVTGKTHWVRDECRLAKSDGDAVLVGCIVDVSDRRIAERALQRALDSTRAEVSAAAADRDLLVSAASHELAEPIRKIRTFGALLEESAGPGLDDAARTYVRHMTEAAGRLQGLVRDLLEYTSRQDDAATWQDLPLRGAVDDALAELAPEIAAADARVSVGDLPVVRGERAGLQRVFRNLVANAIQAARPGVPPVVDIEGRTVGAWHEIAVTDNGVGFEPHLAERILEPLARLKASGDAPGGSGVGLAMCRRIVERHGGTITPTGRPDEGATFTLRLPADPPLDRRT